MREDSRAYMRRKRWSERLTTRQLQALAVSLEYDRHEAAYRLGLTYSGLDSVLHRLYVRMGVLNKAEAAIKIGWLRIPAEYTLEAPPGATPWESPSTGGRPVVGRGEVAARHLAASPSQEGET